MKGNESVKYKKALTIDIGRCSECMGCVEVAPEVFRYNEDNGYLEVIDMQEYPEDIVREAIKCCPKDCIVFDGD